MLSRTTEICPGAHIVYAADNAGFPYGRLSEDALVTRVLAVMERLVARFHPDLVVIACNTASTLVLPALRARFAIPFVGTVPAIKPAAERNPQRHDLRAGDARHRRPRLPRELIETLCRHLRGHAGRLDETCRPRRAGAEGRARRR